MELSIALGHDDFKLQLELPEEKSGLFEVFLLPESDWRKRFVVLTDCSLKCFRDETCLQMQKTLYLCGTTSVTILKDFEGRCNVLVVTNRPGGEVSETVYIATETSGVRDEWLQAVNDAVHGDRRSVSLPGVWPGSFRPEMQVRATFQSAAGDECSATGGAVVPQTHLDSPPALRLLKAVSVSSGESHSEGDLYAAVIVSAVSRDGGPAERKCHLHWAAVNWRGSEAASSAVSGAEVASWDLGQVRGHSRCFTLVFRQQAVVVLSDAQVEAAAVAACEQGSGFDIALWAGRLALGSAPVAVDWFRTDGTAQSAASDCSSCGLSIDASHCSDGVPHPPLSPIMEDVADGSDDEPAATFRNLPSTPPPSLRRPANDAAPRSNCSGSPGRIVVSPETSVDSPMSSSISGVSGISSLSLRSEAVSAFPSPAFDSPPTGRRGSHSTAHSSSSTSIRSALKKAAVGGESPVASSSSGRKRLGVSFMIVHPTLTSDYATHVNASFYEGYRRPRPSASEDEEDDDDEDGGGGRASFEDVPDYQVDYDCTTPRSTSTSTRSGSDSSSDEVDVRSSAVVYSRLLGSGAKGPFPPHSTVIPLTSVDEQSRGTGGSAAENGTERLPDPPPPPPPGGSISPRARQGSSRASSLNGFGGTDQMPPVPSLRRGTSSENGVNGSRSSLVPLMQRVSQCATTQELCAVFGIATAEVFEGALLRKKFSGDLRMKPSFVWIAPASKSIHWAKAVAQKSSANHKHILLDRRNTHDILDTATTAASAASSDSAAPTQRTAAPVPAEDAGAAQSFKQAAAGSLAGAIRGAELEDLTITVTTEANQRLKIKIDPQGGGAAATLRAKEWFRVIKLLTQDTAS